MHELIVFYSMEQSGKPEGHYIYDDPYQHFLIDGQQVSTLARVTAIYDRSYFEEDAQITAVQIDEIMYEPCQITML